MWPETDMLHDMNSESINSISSNFEELIKVHQPELETNVTLKKAEVSKFCFHYIVILHNYTSLFWKLLN